MEQINVLLEAYAHDPLVAGLVKALGVIVLTPTIAEHLRATDPNALVQAEAALAVTPTPQTVAVLTMSDAEDENTWVFGNDGIAKDYLLRHVGASNLPDTPEDRDDAIEEYFEDDDNEDESFKLEIIAVHHKLP